MSAQEIIENAKAIRQRLRNPPNAVRDPGINLTRKSTAHKGDGPAPDAPPKKLLGEPKTAPVYPEIKVIPKMFEHILRAVSLHYGVSVENMRGASRRSDICYARFVAIYLAIKMKAKPSLSAIARGLNKDHTSILHARTRINDIIASNPERCSEINMIEKYLEDNYRPPVPAIGQCGLAIQPWASPPEPEVQCLDG